MIRFICRQDDVAPLVHAGLAADTIYRTFTDAAELESWLRFNDLTGPGSRDLLTRRLVGAELVDDTANTPEKP